MIIVQSVVDHRQCETQEQQRRRQNGPTIQSVFFIAAGCRRLLFAIIISISCRDAARLDKNHQLIAARMLPDILVKRLMLGHADFQIFSANA
jgi:hypothetical protein